MDNLRYGLVFLIVMVIAPVTGGIATSTIGSNILIIIVVLVAGILYAYIIIWVSESEKMANIATLNTIAGGIIVFLIG